MPFDKDDEFELFYDFSRAYKEMPQKPMLTAPEDLDVPIDAKEERQIERNQRMASKKGSSSASKNDGAEESDDWEDVDVDDGDMEDVEEADSEEEDSAETPSLEESKSSGFVVVGSEQEPSQSSFSIIDSKAKDSLADS